MKNNTAIKFRAPGFYNHVKFTREGNFKIAHIKDDATDKDEFICKIMETGMSN